MTGLDRAALLAWLNRRAESPTPAIHAVYHGLIDRIQRGQFDTDQRPRKEE